MLQDTGALTKEEGDVIREYKVSPSSAVVVMSEGSLSDSDWGIVEPQSFSFL